MSPGTNGPKDRNLLTGALGPTGALLLAVALFWWLIQPPKPWILGGIAGAGLLLLALWAWLDRAHLREILGGRTAKFGTNSVVLTLVVLGLLGVANYGGQKVGHRFDLTATKLYSLSPETLSVLKHLQGDLHATAFFKDENQERERASDLLAEYAARSAHFQFRKAEDLVDPERKPELARKFGVREDGTIIVDSGTQQQRVLKATEEELTNAVVKASRTEKKTVCFLEGHGEGGPEDSGNSGYEKAAKALESQGYTVRKLLLVQEAAVPPECKVVVAAGPQHALLPKEIEVLRSFAARGGRALVELDPPSQAGQAETGLEGLVREWGVEVGRNIVVDELSRLFGNSPVIPMATSYGNHDITKDLKKGEAVMATIFPLARTVAPVATLPGGLQVEKLVNTSAQSFAVPSDRIVGGKVRPDPKHDQAGPLSLGVAVAAAPATAPAAAPARGAPEPHEPRAVVYGNAAFASNRYFDLMGNGDLFLNSVNWLAQERDLISIRPKERGMSLVHMDPAQMKGLLSLYVVILPGLVMLSGAWMWWKRRRL